MLPDTVTVYELVLLGDCVRLCDADGAMVGLPLTVGLHDGVPDRLGV